MVVLKCRRTPSVSLIKLFCFFSFLPLASSVLKPFAGLAHHFSPTITSRYLPRSGARVAHDIAFEYYSTRERLLLFVRTDCTGDLSNIFRVNNTNSELSKRAATSSLFPVKVQRFGSYLGHTTAAALSVAFISPSTVLPRYRLLLLPPSALSWIFYPRSLPVRFATKRGTSTRTKHQVYVPPEQNKRESIFINRVSGFLCFLFHVSRITSHRVPGRNTICFEFQHKAFRL